MAILATSRRWEVTSRWAASRSPCSFQLLASMYSSSGCSMGNRRICWRYRLRPPSLEIVGNAERGMRALSGAKLQRPQSDAKYKHDCAYYKTSETELVSINLDAPGRSSLSEG